MFFLRVLTISMEMIEVDVTSREEMVDMPAARMSITTRMQNSGLQVLITVTRMLSAFATSTPIALPAR